MLMFFLIAAGLPFVDICKLIGNCLVHVPASVQDNIQKKNCTDFSYESTKYQLFLNYTNTNTNTNENVLNDTLYQPSLYCLATLYGQFNRNNRLVEQGTSSLDKTVTCKDGPFTVDYFSCKSFVNLRDKLLKEKKTLEDAQSALRKTQLVAEQKGLVSANSGDTNAIKLAGNRVTGAETTYASARAAFYTQAIIRLNAAKKNYINVDETTIQCNKQRNSLAVEKLSKKQKKKDIKPCEVFTVYESMLFPNSKTFTILKDLLAEYSQLALNEGMNIASLLLLKDKSAVDEPSSEPDIPLPEVGNESGSLPPEKTDQNLVPNISPTSLPQGGGGGSGGGGTASAGVPGQDNKPEKTESPKLPATGGNYSGSAGGSVGALFSGGDNQGDSVLVAENELEEELALPVRELSGINDIQISALNTNLFIKISKRHEELKKKNYFKISL
jgi:hypothetical protein